MLLLLALTAQLSLSSCDSDSTNSGTTSADLAGASDPGEANASDPAIGAATAQLGGATGVGQWGPVIDLSIVPVGAANLPDGNILFFTSTDRLSWFEPGHVNNQTYTSIFDPITTLNTEHLVTNPAHDMFCPGTAMLADGRLLISGGIGNKQTSIYDPKTEEWTSAARMNIGRGYQANTVLPSGNVLTLGGSWSGGQGNKHAEVFSLASGWQLLPGLPVTPLLDGINDPRGIYANDNHAWLFTAPNGKVFHAGPSSNMHWLDTSGDGSFTDAGPRSDDFSSIVGTTVMYDVGKLLKAGGSTAYASRHPASDRTYLIDINQTNPITLPQPNLAYSRTMHNSVVLPDGQVIVVGGISEGKTGDDTGSRLIPELWNPSTRRWRELAPMQKPRNYHSVAILLPDARVLAAGGGYCGRCVSNHPNAEIYSPPYLFDGDSPAVRPVMYGVPESAGYGSTIKVQTDSPVNDFSLVRFSAVTHSTNNDQRRIPLTATATGANFYDLSIPANRGVVLPGYYMLFAMNNAGTPSVASMIQIGDNTESKYNFDFGTSSSPLRTGWTRISENTNTGVVSWSGATPVSLDRGATRGVNEINRDMVVGSDAATLNLNVGSGTWRVILNMGDSAVARDKMMVKVEGETIYDNINATAGEFVYVSQGQAWSVGTVFDVVVEDDVMNVELSDQGGSDPEWAITRLSLERIVGDEPVVRPNAYNFDFGTTTSPLRPGWLRVSENLDTGVVSWEGDARSSVDRGAINGVNDINRDLVYGAGTSTLNLDIGNGVWRVILNMGDAAFRHDSMAVSIEGQNIHDSITSAVREFVYVSPGLASSAGETFNVAVTDGVMNIELSDLGGQDPNWVLTRLSLLRVADIEPATEVESPSNYNFDFGTDASPVARSWTRITPDSNNDVVSWSGAARDSRDRGAINGVNVINRDFVFGSGASTLNLKTGNGTWRVILNLGDASFPHDAMAIKVEGETIYNNANTATRQFVYVSRGMATTVGATFDVVVTDGVLNIELADTGGIDPNWAITRLSLERISE